MKKITCEMCGSSDMLKQDGVFVCQTCGTKYSVEEAKNLMVEVTGTVKVDNSEKIDNLYTIARRAKDDNNIELAQKNYEAIMQENPSDWESLFYCNFFKAKGTNMQNMQHNLHTLSNSINSTFRLIKDTIKEESRQLEIIKEITNNVNELSETCYESALIFYFQHNSLPFDDFIGWINSIVQLQEKMETSLAEYYPHESKEYRIDYLKAQIKYYKCEGAIDIGLRYGTMPKELLWYMPSVDSDEYTEKVESKMRELDPNSIQANSSINETKKDATNQNSNNVEHFSPTHKVYNRSERETIQDEINNLLRQNKEINQKIIVLQNGKAKTAVLGVSLLIVGIVFMLLSIILLNECGLFESFLMISFTLLFLIGGISHLAVYNKATNIKKGQETEIPTLQKTVANNSTKILELQKKLQNTK